MVLSRQLPLGYLARLRCVVIKNTIAIDRDGGQMMRYSRPAVHMCSSAAAETDAPHSPKVPVHALQAVRAQHHPGRTNFRPTTARRSFRLASITTLWFGFAARTLGAHQTLEAAGTRGERSCGAKPLVGRRSAPPLLSSCARPETTISPAPCYLTLSASAERVQVSVGFVAQPQHPHSSNCQTITRSRARDSVGLRLHILLCADHNYDLERQVSGKGKGESYGAA